MKPAHVYGVPCAAASADCPPFELQARDAIARRTADARDVDPIARD
jgi:hypothetical protein